MEIIGTILHFIFSLIFNFFKFVWAKWRLAGVLAVFFIIELMVLIPVYENSVNEIATRTIRNYEIVGVEQTDLPGDNRRIIVTIENNGSDRMTGSSSAKVEVNGKDYFLILESNYQLLKEQGYNFYGRNIVPAATTAKMVYSFGEYILDQERPHGNAKLIIDDYYNDSIKEFEFELKPVTETPDAPGE